ncbi:hypothetical protein [Streptomyces sp. NPDC004285]
MDFTGDGDGDVVLVERSTGVPGPDVPEIRPDLPKPPKHMR